MKDIIDEKKVINITELPIDEARDVLMHILELGCLAQRVDNILYARKIITHIPEKWLIEHLPDVVEQYLFLEWEWQEWEFRRLTEMLEGRFPLALMWVINYAKQLNNPEVNLAIIEHS